MIRELSLLWKRFSPLEQHLLLAVRQVLPPAAVPTFDAQVAAITRVQRLPPSWSEIDFYCMRRGKVNWLGVPLFPCTDEFRLAEVSFRVRSKGYKATLSNIRGHIFDFAITPGPRGVAFEPWDTDPIARLVSDPLRTPTGRKESEMIPAMWRDFLDRHPGPPPAGWIFNNEATTYRMALEDDVYLILAERDGSAFILYRVEPPSAALFYLPHYDCNPEELAGDVESVVAGQNYRTDSPK